MQLQYNTWVNLPTGCQKEFFPFPASRAREMILSCTQAPWSASRLSVLPDKRDNSKSKGLKEDSGSTLQIPNGKKKKIHNNKKLFLNIRNLGEPGYQNTVATVTSITVDKRLWHQNVVDEWMNSYWKFLKVLESLVKKTTIWISSPWFLDCL